ncbi:MAG: hypothetical protein JWM47_2198 [Acidimicrobiales bacterium]|nr:hypothetical protein [Acidimicrobiales bacterium]
MGAVVGFLAIIVLIAVLSVVVVGVLAVRNKAAFEEQAKLMPGVATSAPTAWAGSHEPEARLHRRLRDAMAALAANQAFDDDGSLLDLRVDLQQQAVALDEQLVITSALPLHLRAEPLGRIGGAVDAIEQAVADLAGSSVAEVSARMSRVLDEVSTRTGIVAQARAALDELGPMTEADLTAPDVTAPDATTGSPGQAEPQDADEDPEAQPGA